MKKSLSKQKMFSRIPFSKSKGNKMNLDFSIKGLGRIVTKNKYDSINKETIDGSCTDTQTFAFNQDSINNSKGTINKNYSFGRLDNKLIIFTSSLKNGINKNDKLLNISKKFKTKTSPDFYTENISSYEEDNNIIMNNNQNNEIKENESDDEDTNRIDYRYYPKIPEIESNKETTYFWLATYDKLMKKSKIIKILNYYTGFSPKKFDDKELKDEEKESKDCKEEVKQKCEKYNFKEKSMIIDGYEIYFLNKFNKPFIRPKKGGSIFIKLYLLNIEQINKIFSYINRLEYKSYINSLDSIKDKNFYKIIKKTNKSIYNYSTIFCIGSFVNINIFLFSHLEKSNKKLNKSIFDINDLPSSNKLAKLIKILLINFPEYSKEYFIDYLMKPIQKNFELNNDEKELLNQKKSEISSLLITNHKKSLQLKPSKINANTIIKNVIQKIPTYTHSSNKTPDDFYNFSDISALNDKCTNNNKNNNNEINNSKFLKKVKLKKQKSEKSFKKIDTECLIAKKISDISLKGNYPNNKNNFTNRLPINDNIKIKFFNISNSIRHIKLIDPKKKSLTRHNTNKASIQYKEKDIVTKDNSKNKNGNRLINRFKELKQNKENNKNLLNIYKNDLNINSNYIQIDNRQHNKSTRNKMNLNPFYLTNTNNTKINNNSKKTRNKKYNEPVRVLSSIRKVISQKINNLASNASSLNLINVNASNSNSSFIGNKNNYLNNEPNKRSNYNKLVCKTNNNSQNKKSEYITPIKEKFNYYYH